MLDAELCVRSGDEDSLLGLQSLKYLHLHRHRHCRSAHSMAKGARNRLEIRNTNN